ncbi:MAG: phosphatidylserine/phosphatidylglycerophosphate/cardiolipin synthase family protein [bacterium]|nr:phosphatidylserine/phosphatidylglycerophosphate/cardiolipin synthase family protein [bacterium]
MLEGIKQARSSIYWEVYIFEDDLGLEYDFFKTLTDKARGGVKVRIVLDGFGSMNLSNSTVDRLKEAGAEVLFFNSWFRRIHRKILIVDEEVAFLGGVNVGKAYKKWLDLNLRLNGKRIVKSLVKSFSRSYYNSGGTDPNLLTLRKELKTRRAGLWLLENFPAVGKLMLRPYYQEQIAGAKKRIVLVTPYFIPHRWLLASLLSAQARGVSVELVIPKNTDSNFISFANHVFISSLSKTGMKFYMTKDMIHAKAILVDDKVGLVGSNNLDAMSFDHNAEASVSFERKEMVRDLKNIIDIWQKDAMPWQHNSKYEGWYYKFMEYIVRLIQPVL